MRPFVWTSVLLLGAVLGMASCGSDDESPSSAGEAESADTGDEGMDDADTDESDMAMDDTEMAMNMGDADAVPADDVEGAELVSGTFELLDTRPEGYDETTGTAALARHDAGTTVTIRLEGLQPDVDYIAHVHDGPCTDSGGDHYKFDPEGSELPPNEIHLAFVADADGSGFMTAENAMTAGPEAESVVVHPMALLDNKIACAQL